MANVHDLPKALSQPVQTPHNLAAEMAVLGAILFDNNAHERIADVLSPADFYSRANAEIFSVLDRMISNGRVGNGVTLREHFERDGQLSEIGGVRYLAELIDAAAFGPEIIDYARIIRDLAIRRELINIGSEIVQKAAEATVDETGEQQLEAAEKRLFSLAEKGVGAQGFVEFANALAVSINTATAAYKRDGKIAGVATGLDDLDRLMGGLHPSDLVILAARPSMGKTALAVNIAFNAAKRCKREAGPDGAMKTTDGAVVGFFSLEMSSDQLATRVLADIAGVASDKLRKGELTPSDYEAMREAADSVVNLPLYIDDMGGISISQIAARARRQQRMHGLDLLIIDYLQLITPGAGSRSDSRVQEVTQITMSLKALAKELHIPIIALSQLSRQVENREDKRPQLSDLRESGSIEQDADAVLFIYREAYYLERLEPDENDPKHADWKAQLDAKFNVAEIIISKQRHGPIGKVDVGFSPARVKFSNLERPRYDDGRG